MNKTLKRILIGLMVLVITLVVTTYFALKTVGMISRDDYDSVPPELTGFNKPAVLVFTKTNGYIHTETIPVAQQVLKELIEAQGWEPYITDNAAIHNPEQLKQFDFIIWSNCSGDVLTSEQREAFKGWLEQGGGWLGIHASGGDFSYDWDWYVNRLLGAQFVGHTMNPQFQDAHVLVANPELDITGHLSAPWKVEKEEWYAFDRNPRNSGYEILLTVDESSYQTEGQSFFMIDRMEGEHPLAWRHQLGKGRVLYSAIGHQPFTYQNADYQQFLVKAMHWVRGK